MAPQTAKSLMKEFRASFRRKKDPTPKIDKAKEIQDDERTKLAELKENLGQSLPAGYNDTHLLSFLRARLLKIKDAEKLLALDVSLKKFLQLENMLSDYNITEISKDYRMSNVIGYDKDGSLVRVMNIGLFDIKGYVNCMSTVEHFKVVLWIIERDLKLSEKGNKKKGDPNQIVYILDLANINLTDILHKPALDTSLLALKLLQDHYHDIVKSVYIVNAPTLFQSTFKVFKPVIQEALYRKIQVYGSDGYKEELLRQIDADILPVYLGGSRRVEGEDPSGKQFVGMGGEIPLSYYPNHFLDPEEEADLIKCNITAGSSVSYRFPILHERTIVIYHFQAKENDIGLCLFMDDDEVIEKRKKKDEDISKLVQLVPIIRSQCHLCPEVGGFVTWFTGTLVVYFDNTYSWMNSKEVAFKLKCLPPDSSTPEFTRNIIMRKQQTS